MGKNIEKLESLLESLGDRLHVQDRTAIIEYIDVGEWGMGFYILVDKILSEVPLSRDEFEALKFLAEATGEAFYENALLMLSNQVEPYPEG